MTQPDCSPGVLTVTAVSEATVGRLELKRKGMQLSQTVYYSLPAANMPSYLAHNLCHRPNLQEITRPFHCQVAAGNNPKQKRCYQRPPRCSNEAPVQLSTVKASPAISPFRQWETSGSRCKSLRNP